ncbi:2-keto-4-pentenoate hydratase [Roseomonas sp. CCTCC AB2023176]|uniref:2-keto-4-pentenoate hydratase n=1 Tax=Roseomonas sp. CCTCC AB2023176 TaxID=3342640 RepID=UPI0035D8D9CA
MPAAVPAQAACPDLVTVARFAHALLERRPVPAYPAPLSLADAACAQQLLIRTLSQPYGDPVGYKVALADAASQRRYGIPHPLRGTIFHGTVRATGTPDRPAEIPAGFGVAPAMQSGLLVRVASENINAAGSDHVAILRTIDLVMPFIELPDLAAPADRLDGPALVATNLGTRLGVLGEAVVARATGDFARRLASMTVTLSADGAELARATGATLLGHPLDALAWVIEDLRREGRELRVGEYVLLGALSPALPLRQGATVTATIEGLLDRPVAAAVRTP